MSIIFKEIASQPLKLTLTDCVYRIDHESGAGHLINQESILKYFPDFVDKTLEERLFIFLEFGNSILHPDNDGDHGIVSIDEVLYDIAGGVNDELPCLETPIRLRADQFFALDMPSILSVVLTITASIGA